jgi:hypothetical protein
MIVYLYVYGLRVVNAKTASTRPQHDLVGLSHMVAKYKAIGRPMSAAITKASSNSLIIVYPPKCF